MDNFDTAYKTIYDKTAYAFLMYVRTCLNTRRQMIKEFGLVFYLCSDNVCYTAIRISSQLYSNSASF